MDGPSQQSNAGPTDSNSESAERPRLPIADFRRSKFTRVRWPLSAISRLLRIAIEHINELPGVVTQIL